MANEIWYKTRDMFYPIGGHQPADGIAGHAQVVFHGNLGCVFDLPVRSSDGSRQSTRCHRTRDSHLALAPNLRRYVPGFVGRVLRFTIPAGIAVAIAGRASPSSPTRPSGAATGRRS